MTETDTGNIVPDNPPSPMVALALKLDDESERACDSHEATGDPYLGGFADAMCHAWRFAHDALTPTERADYEARKAVR